MKKNLVLAVIAIFLVMPLTSFAKIAISDSCLAAITAQNSVSINLSKLKLSDVSAKSIWWSDADGFNGYTAKGYVGTTDLTLTGEVMGFGSGANGVTTIDIGYTGGITKVQMETPEVIIGGTDGMIVNATIKLGTDETLTDQRPLGHFYMDGVKAKLPGGVMTIEVHTSSEGSGRYFAQ